MGDSADLSDRTANVCASVRHVDTRERTHADATDSFAVYVAGSAAPSEAPRIAAAIASLRANGFVVTCSWPDVVATVGDANPRTASVAERRGWSTQDLNEVDAADAVWFLVPEPPLTTRGAWFEAGYAYSEHKHLVFSGDTRQSVFTSLGIECDSDMAAMAHLRGLRERARIEVGLDEIRDAVPIVPLAVAFDLSDEDGF